MIRGDSRRDFRYRKLRTFFRNKIAVIGAFISFTIVLVAVLAPLISPHDILKQDVFHRFAPPGPDHPLGTDEFGRDVLSRTLFGIRLSLLVGVVSTFLGMMVGTGLGLIAAYWGGTMDMVIMRAMDVLMAFPGEVLGVMIMVMLGSGLPNVIIAITILLTPRFARLAYAPTRAVREFDYVCAARAIGMTRFRIISRHILPNIFPEILVMGTLWIGTAIRLEANLSFLGLGVPPPFPTLGNMIRSGVDRLATAPWISVFPGLAIMIIILGFNTLGDGLRDIGDPKLYV